MAENAKYESMPIVLALMPVAIFFSALYSSNAYSDDAILLNCDRYDGEQEFQIYINEAEEYVLYNAQTRDSYERERTYSVKDGEEGETTVLDEGLDIIVNNDVFIQARDDSSTFVFIKKTATYAYAWTMPLPVKGKWFAFGNHHEGKCWTNPYVQQE